MDCADLKITYFEALGDGYLLAFTAGKKTLRLATRAILALDPWQRRWIAAEYAWWISDDAISRLARHLPPVGVALYQWHARPITLEDLLNWGEYGTSRPRMRRNAYVPPDVAAAYAALGLPPGAPAEAVTAARRTLARQHHPDAGGVHEAMAAINHAADTVIGWLERRRATLPTTTTASSS